MAGLLAELDRFPDLATAHGTAHGTARNDLLGLATATCDERLAQVLLERGADPRAANTHGWTPVRGLTRPPAATAARR